MALYTSNTGGNVKGQQTTNIKNEEKISEGCRVYKGTDAKRIQKQRAPVEYDMASISRKKKEEREEKRATIPLNGRDSGEGEDLYMKCGLILKGGRG